MRAFLIVLLLVAITIAALQLLDGSAVPITPADSESSSPDATEQVVAGPSGSNQPPAVVEPQSPPLTPDAAQPRNAPAADDDGAWFITGVCRTEYTPPGERPEAPGTKITIEFVTSSTTSIASGITDSDGRFKIDVSALRRTPRIDRVMGHLLLYADRGLLSTPNPTRIHGIPVDEPREWTKFVVIELEEMSVVSGRVVDGRGQPVTGAQIGFTSPGDSGWTLPGGLITNADGRFRAHLWDTSALVAMKNSVGVSRAVPCVIPARKPTRLDLGDIVLQPKGILSGNVVFPDGTPARWLPVYIDAADEENAPERAGDLTAGDWSASTETDELGRFVVRTLHRNPAGWKVSAWQLPDSWFSELATAPDKARNIVVRFPHRRVLVRPRHADGRPIRRSYVTVRVWRGETAATAAEAYASGQNLEALVERAIVNRTFEPDEPGDSGIVSFTVRPKDYVLVTMGDAGLEPFTHAFVATADRWETVIDAARRSTRNPARLALFVRTEAGEKPKVRVTLRDPVTRDTITNFVRQLKWQAPPIAPGRYEITVEQFMRDPFHIHPRPMTTLLPETRIVHLTPGENRIYVTLEPGGRVNVRPRTDRKLPEYEQLIVRFINLQRPGDKPRIARHWSRAYHDHDATWEWGTHGGKFAATPGGLLSPGRWRIRAEFYPTERDADANENMIASAERTVVVVAGETVDVAIDL